MTCQPDGPPIPGRPVTDRGECHGNDGGQGRTHHRHRRWSGPVAALTFAREGAKVVGADLQVAGNNETVELVRRAGGEMTGIAPVDLTDPDQVRRLVDDAVAAYGGLDVVYNNAAALRFGPMPDFSVEDWRYTITGELDIPYFVSKFAWPHLVQRGGGVIINAASMAGMIGGHVPPMVGHTAANAGIIGMTRQLALEGAPHGIRAVAVSPGPPSPRPVSATSATTRRRGTPSPAKPYSSASPAPRRSSNWWSSSPRTGRRTSPGRTTRSTAARPPGNPAGTRPCSAPARPRRGAAPALHGPGAARRRPARPRPGREATLICVLCSASPDATADVRYPDSGRCAG
ncbi:SDR family oxidoreductase [Micromonospora sp. M12]